MNKLSLGLKENQGDFKLEFDLFNLKKIMFRTRDFKSGLGLKQIGGFSLKSTEKKLVGGFKIDGGKTRRWVQNL